MSKTIRTASGLEKQASRLTLADLFGPGPLPSPEEIARTAQAEKARTQAKKKKESDPGHKARLDAIRAAAQATATSPEWTKHWHPTARVFVEIKYYCTCGATHTAPANRSWLVEYTNSRNGTTHSFDPSGPVDNRLPAKKKTLNESVAVCHECFPNKANGQEPSA